jgi:hypothetical protein
MNALTPITLSMGGLLQFYENEVEMKSASDVHLYSQNGIEKQTELFQNTISKVILTNMRLVIFINGSKGINAWALPFSIVEFVEDCAKNLFSRSTRLRISICRNIGGSGGGSGSGTRQIRTDLGLGFERNGLGLEDSRKYDFLTIFEQVLIKKSWIDMEIKKSVEARTQAIVNGTDFIGNMSSSSSSSSSTAAIVESHSNSISSTSTSTITTTTTTTTKTTSSINASKTYGVGGILQRHQSSIVTANQLTTAVNSDLKNLMQSAKDVVDMVEIMAKYKHTKAKAKAKNSEVININDSLESADVDVDADGDGDGDINSILLSIGMIHNPVTRASTSTLTSASGVASGVASYYDQLSRQINDLLLKNNTINKDMGGMITLIDLYCIYNRLRGGTNLVSPEDLKKACDLLEILDLGLILVKYKSGLLVVQSKHLSSDIVCKRILQLFNDNDNDNDNRNSKSNSKNEIGLQSQEISKLLKIPIQIIKEQLINAENSMLLCRDESVYGVAYFKNIYF